MPFVYKVKIQVDAVYQAKDNPQKKFPVVTHEFCTTDAEGKERFFGHKSAMYKSIEWLMNFSGEE